MTDFSQSLQLIVAEEVLSVTGLVLLLAAAWMGEKGSRAISIIAVAALAACAFIAAPTLCGGLMGPDRVAFMGQYSADAFSAFAKLLIYAAGGAALIVAPSFFARAGVGGTSAMRAEYPVLVLFAVLGMNMMVSATDFLTLYIGLELNSLAAYVLAAFLRTDERSAEAGLKYFVLGALASGIILFGMSLTYGFSGSTNFTAVALALDGPMSTGALFGLIFVLAGLAFKISAVPFHMWTPDVYEGAPTPVTMFFATAPKVAALALTMRVALDAFGNQVGAWQQIVIFVSLASIVVGALGAIGQANIKRLLAYSSINNIGFLLIGLAAATQEGAAAMLVYLAIYVAMSVAGFVVVLMLRDADGNPVEAISDMAGLSRTRPALAWALAAVMFSLAGIPPLFGFWGKFVVFQAAVNADLIALAALGIAASVIGAFYYLKVVKIAFFDEPANVVAAEGEGGVDGLAHKILLLVSCLVISPLGYLATPWLGDLADKAAAALFFVG
ncbi:NADH-quinone oxidoreductase subunit NuoN [Croceicoccus naphthovorans]|uniref:NADH-quinone oxidoreductase subunit N n=1 Tax=Croceicoccus naphthovorans TaxID=1348774 RepID=A0A0G3XFG6_9SPHN|nr:NADH-quinone oxidoreductase subunit NuoN [Croceicoccus naphthovorans]AKM09952.1 NADH-quinone oxidoreductase subunit N [Croceicoccus naphthovorans]MBB3990888.1 NADH-quinone oxidoreductase subunit N [Croceicoccus naphthovorans]